MDELEPQSSPGPARVRRMLNAGSGAATGGRPHPGFEGDSWREVRLDIDATVNPDIVASVIDLKSVLADESFDAIWSSHSLEHLHTHEVIPALQEFRRVLRPDGFALVTCPDLAAIARFALAHGVEAVAYASPVGPVRPLDMIYGHAHSIAAGHVHMTHKTGFTAQRLARVALAAGFHEVRVIAGACFDLWAALTREQTDRAALARQFRDTHVEALFAADEAKAYRPDVAAG
jgi:SAM-dependent methyltransferase